MIRNLKLAIAAAMTLAVFGSVGASGAQAAEFHCSVEPCVLTPNLDGTAKNSHHVIVFKQGADSLSLTCNQVTGEATFEGKTTSELTFVNIVYDACSFAGTSFEVIVNGCDYLLTSSGQLHFKCPAGESISARDAGTGCIISVGEQTVEGISYKTANTPPNREITMSLQALNIAAAANGSCGAFGFVAGAVTAEYATGNTLLRAEDESGAPAETWYE